MIELPYERPPLHMNQRLHWRAEAAIRKALMEATRWSLRSAKVPRLDKARITLIWTVPDRRVRDTDNPAKTVKVCTDALVREKLLIDDGPKYVAHAETRIVYEKGKKGLALLIEEME